MSLSSKHQIIDIFERVFFRHTSAIFPHVARYNRQNELRLTKKYPAQKVSIIQCLLSGWTELSDTFTFHNLLKANELLSLNLTLEFVLALTYLTSNVWFFIFIFI